jgi:hypothetical protein
VADSLVHVNVLLRFLLHTTIVVASAYFLVFLWRTNPELVKLRLFLHSRAIRAFFAALMVAFLLLALEGFLRLLGPLPTEVALALGVAALVVLLAGVVLVVARLSARIPKDIPRI